MAALSNTPSPAALFPSTKHSLSPYRLPTPSTPPIPKASSIATSSPPTFSLLPAARQKFSTSVSPKTSLQNPRLPPNPLPLSLAKTMITLSTLPISPVPAPLSAPSPTCRPNRPVAAISTFAAISSASAWSCTKCPPDARHSAATVPPKFSTASSITRQSLPSVSIPGSRESSNASSTNLSKKIRRCAINTLLICAQTFSASSATPIPPVPFRPPPLPRPVSS